MTKDMVHGCQVRARKALRQKQPYPRGLEGEKFRWTEAHLGKQVH